MGSCASQSRSTNDSCIDEVRSSPLLRKGRAEEDPLPAHKRNGQPTPKITCQEVARQNLGEGDIDQKPKEDGVVSCLDNNSDSGDPLKGILFNSIATSDFVRYAQSRTAVEEMPKAGTPEASFACAARLRSLAQLVETNTISRDDLVRNINYAVNVLEAVYVDETKRLCNEDDELSEVNPGTVPNEVRDWLASTFTRSSVSNKTTREKPKFRSVANAIRAGIMVDKIYRRTSNTPTIAIPPKIQAMLKRHLDDWSFDIFELQEVSDQHALKYMGVELFQRYDLINKLKLNVTHLENFLGQLELGYSKFNNPYHNLMHGADVAQTCHQVMSQSKLVNWLSDLEIFSTIFAALIHDFEHSGTTNNFHINTGSELALLYNDRGVLENHHVSAVFRLLRRDDLNMITCLSKDEYREFRGLVIEMVLNTDMSLHFQQIKTMKNLLSMPENIEKSKALSLMVHCADIAHPAKDWGVHQRWTLLLMQEFFLQGDRESALNLPFSPLCDRKTTLIAQSQIGFIDFIVMPSLELLGDMLEKIMQPLFEQQQQQQQQQSVAPSNATGDADKTAKPKGTTYSYDRPWTPCLAKNKALWKEKSETETPNSHGLLPQTLPNSEETTANNSSPQQPASPLSAIEAVEEKG